MTRTARVVLGATLAIAAVLAITSCTDIFNRGGFRSVQVSMSANTGGARSVSSRAYQIEPVVDATSYKPERQGLTSANFIGAFTPEHFVLQIDRIHLYRKLGDGEYETATIWDDTRLPTGEIIPQHVDLAFADDFIRNAEITGTSWDGFMISFLPGVGDTNHIPQHSFIGVDLSGTDSVDPETTFLNTKRIDPETIELGDLLEVTDDLALDDSGLRYFEFEGLQPFPGNLGFIAIGTDFSQTGIQNAAGVIGDWDLPGGSTDGNATAVFAATETPIDFSGFVNPEIVFNWELKDIVELYRVPGPDDTLATADDEFILTLALDNPFPLSITIQENTEPAGAADADTAPGPVMAPWAGSASSLDTSITDVWNVMHWINPTDPSFDHVVILRKADGTYPSSPTDGELVHEGYKPAFVDPTANPPAAYRYTIWAVSATGRYSAPVEFFPEP